MHAKTDNIQENKSPALAQDALGKKRISNPNVRFFDYRPEALAQRKLQEVANTSAQARHAMQLQELANGYSIGYPMQIKNYAMHATKTPVQLQAKMHAQADKVQESKSPALAQDALGKQRVSNPNVRFADYRPEALAQRKLQQVANTSAQARHAVQLQELANGYPIGYPMQIKNYAKHATNTPVQLQPKSAQIVQRARIEPKGINGLTHLVEMTEAGHIYTGEDWLANERDEVKTGDQLLVDMDDAWYSHRGIDQESNWQQDGDEKQSRLWVAVLELNHAPVGKNLYVREEILSKGWSEWTQAPKKMHSIWVQGDIRENKEAMDGIESRRGKDTEGWVDMVWLYNTGVKLDEYKPVPMVIDSAKIAPVMTRSFFHEMANWRESKNMPEWVKNWLPILDILYEKKSFITMSDLMRMIILYCEGGVYLDVKIKVQNDKALFKECPMVKVNTANFYERENWAIMADAGCQMIQDMMVQAYKQFPKATALEEYPTNYSEEARSDGKKREGKMHVDLHERLGVWNVIDRAERPGFSTSLVLHNPRPLNSWVEAYEDRPIGVIRAEQQRQREDDLGKLDRELTNKRREKEKAEKLLGLRDTPQVWAWFELTQEMMKGFPETIEKLALKIDLLEMNLKSLQTKPLPCDAVEDEAVSEDGDDELTLWLKELRQR